MKKRIAMLGATVLLGMPGFARAQAQTAPAINGSIWTLQEENASVSFTSPTDRYYVNGLHIGWTGPEGMVPGAIANFGHELLGEGAQRVSIGITQQIYTPWDTKAYNPPLNDEPYAGYLAINLGFLQDAQNTRTLAGFNIGLIGPWAGAQSVQNGFHAIIGQKGTNGWHYQLPNEPIADLLGARIWRLPLGHIGGLETDALPQISGMAGLSAVYLQPAVGFRIGSGLSADYGPSLLSPSPSGGEAYTQVQPLVWYLFASAASKFVAHDVTLQGANFESSRNVTETPVVGSFEAGITVIWRGLRFSYTQVFQTDRFHGQVGNIHEFGALAVSGTF